VKVFASTPSTMNELYHQVNIIEYYIVITKDCLLHTNSLYYLD